MCQTRNETARLIWIAPHGSFFSLGSQFKLPRSESSLEQMRLLADETVTRTLSSAVRSSAWIQWWTQMTLIQTSLKANRRNTVQRDSQKAFQSTRRPHLPWIYCSNIHCTMFLWQKFGILKLNFITGVMVYNYSTYLWLGYSMCAFILNVFRLLFFIQIDYLKVIYIFIDIYLPWYWGAICVDLTVFIMILMYATMGDQCLKNKPWSESI